MSGDRERRSDTSKTEADSVRTDSSGALQGSDPDPDPDAEQEQEQEPDADPARGPTVPELLAALLPRKGEHLEPGDVVGRGGMGAVLTTYDRGLDRRVALKRLSYKSAAKTTWVATLIREARLTARLDHPCVVPIYEVGVREEGEVYYTMKLVEGEQLSTLVRRTPASKRPRSELLDLIDALIQVCGAVSAAHAIGYVHCDIKPQNIMIGRFGAVYLMDWGGAQAFGQARARERRSPESQWLEGRRLSVRTPAFMAPEQARRERVSPKTDVFLLGSVLYFVLTGASPFGDESIERMRERAAACDFRPPSAVEPGVSPTLEAIVLRAMAADPEARYPSSEALAGALKAVQRGGGWTLPVATYPAGAMIIREGELAHTAYVILSGSCEVLRGGQRLRIMTVDEVFGETAIFAGVPRSASVRALEATTLGVVSRETFEHDVAQWNPWMARFVQTLAKRLAGE